MSKLLNKYKKYIEDGNDVKTSFLNIFKEIQELPFEREPISEEKAREILELGDFLFSNESILKFIKEDKNHNIFKELYDDLKNVFRKDRNFNKECEDILVNLDVIEVRELESLYKQINKFSLDKEYTISYKDGLVYSSTFLLGSSSFMPNVLEFKSYIAKALIEGGIFVCDFLDFDNDTILSAGFVFQNKKWYPLKENFVSTIHKRNDFPRQQFIAIPKEL